MTERERDQADERRTNSKAWAEKSDSRFESTAVKIPPPFTQLKTVTPSMLLDIIEYRVGEGNPEADPGFLHFERTYYTHRVPSPEGGNLYCCQWECFKLPCPICDWMKDNGRNADPQLLKDMRSQKRHLWNAIDLNTRDLKVQVFDTNHFNRGMGFGEQIKAALRAVPHYNDFARYDGGMSLILTTAEQTMGGGRKYTAVTRIDFVPRRQQYSKAILNECCCLDDCLLKIPYDELQAKFMQRGMSSNTTTSLPPQQQSPPGDQRSRYAAPPPTQNGDMRQRDADMEREARRAAPDYTPPASRYAEPPQQPTQQPQPPQTPPVHSQAPPPQAPQQPPPQDPPGRQPTAPEYGVTLWDTVKMRSGKPPVDLEVVRISRDGTSLTLEDKDGMEYRAISPADVEVIKKAGNAGQVPAPAAAQAPPPPQQAPSQPPQSNRRFDEDFDRPRQPAQVPVGSSPARRD